MISEPPLKIGANQLKPILFSDVIEAIFARFVGASGV